ncbi:hypothetical protein ACWIUD_05745 [Helicobacter sp. 23-1044]
MSSLQDFAKQNRGNLICRFCDFCDRFCDSQNLSHYFIILARSEISQNFK